LLGWRQANRATLVLVTHDPALARHAERVVELRDGRLAADRLNGHGRP
jgi:predicted ABC-type transport system involved in lysophospholipase L1 biosynthesis ATPase subunit